MSHKVVQLHAGDDAGRLQRLLDRCSDYYELHEEWPTPSDAGEFELTVDPKAPANAELLVFALERSDGTLDAVAQIFTNAPEPGTWWIGLLVVAPKLRSRGIGSDLVRHMLAVAADADVRTIKLAVSLRNPRAQQFWEKAGFRDTGKVYDVTARSGHVDQGRIMARDVDQR